MGLFLRLTQQPELRKVIFLKYFIKLLYSITKFLNNLLLFKGVYLYLESSPPSKKYDNSILVSPNLDPIQATGCFGLYYFMHGKDVYQFNVYKNDSANGYQLLNKFEGEQGFAWQQLLLNITSQVEFKIYVEAIVTYFYIYYFI